MVASKTLRIELESNDLGQVLEGLRIREEAWRQTAEYLRTGFCPEDFIIEECNSFEEATRVADHYLSIVEQIERQVNQQGGW